MSFQAMAWAIKREIPNTTAKFVFLMLANYADENGHCYPSLARIARDISASESTVRRAIQWLEENGWITSSERTGKSTVFTLLDPLQIDTPVKMQGVSKCTGTPVKLTPEPIKNLSLPQKDKPSSGERAERAHRIPPEFLPSEANLDRMRSEGWTDGEMDRETEKFRDHWLSSSGANARKHDWQAAWRKWMRETADRRAAIRQAPQNRSLPQQVDTDRVRQMLAEREARRNTH